MSQELIGRGWAFPLHINPQGSISLTNERSEIDQAIEIILSTAPGQRVMRPSFGCRLQELVFAPNNNQTAAQARRFVEEALGMWEPRIQVKNVRVAPDPTDGARMLIEIEYLIRSSHNRRSLVHPFYLIPEETTAMR